MNERYKIVGAAYLILRDGDKVLLGRRCNTGHRDGEYGLPSGHLESGETFLQAALREALEEVGVTLNPNDVHCIHVGHRWKSDYVDLFFTASVWSGEIQNMEPEKCDDLRWFSLDALPSNTIPYIVKVLMDVRESRIYSEE